MHCGQLEEIPESCFECASWYGQPKLVDVVEEKPQLVWRGCNQLKKVDDFAFNCFRLDQDELSFPLAMEKLGQYAFGSTLIKKVVFAANLLSVDWRVFANTFYQPLITSIKKIDFTCYDQIIYHNDDEETYIPPWFKEFNTAFYCACNDDVEVDKAQKIADEVGSDKIEEWKNDLVRNLALPGNSYIHFVETE